MLLTEILCLIILFILGAIMGSFACCQAWRIHYKETGKKSPGKWSVCLSCGKRLKPTENIPIFSWLLQKGKCTSCGAKIGKAEILSELSLGLVFAALGAAILPEILSFSTSIWYPLMLIAISLVLMITITAMWILLVYDAKWSLLPTKILLIVNICAVIYLALRLIAMAFGGLFWQDFMTALPSLLGSVALLAGTYYLLYRLSSEKLVGSGDWLLALPIALILGDWWLALIELFLANFLGSIVGVILRAKKGQKSIPFGPFLILAFIIVYACQGWLLSLISGLSL